MRRVMLRQGKRRSRQDDQLRLEDVPAWVCGQCGEALFDEPQVKAIQSIIRSVDETLRNSLAVAE